MHDAPTSIDLEMLPDDPAVLKAMLIAERSVRADLADEIARLSAIIAAFKRAMFGRRSEKLDPDQMALALEEVTQELAEARAEKDAGDAALKAGRARHRQANLGALPAHLPRIETVLVWIGVEKAPR